MHGPIKVKVIESNLIIPTRCVLLEKKTVANKEMSFILRTQIVTYPFPRVRGPVHISFKIISPILV
jgi:hypothetical protein